MLLKIGSKGEDVKKLQAKLGTTADGNFGPGTEKLVKEWQAANGLTADGIVGDGTWSKMFGETTQFKWLKKMLLSQQVLNSNYKI